MQYRFENYVLDTGRRELRRDAALVAVEPQVFDLVAFLVSNRDRMVSREDLLTSIWSGRIVSESTLGSRISAARRAIGDTGREQRMIRTVIGKGLRFVGPVQEQPTAAQVKTAFASPRLSIAVLPFINLLNDSDEYLGDLITDNLTNDLSRMPNMVVVAGITARAYKGKPVDARHIGRELNVRYVVEGNVHRSASLQLNAQLVNTQTGAHLWADRIDLNPAGPGKLETRVGRLAWMIELQLLETVGRQIEQENPTIPDPRDLLLLGWAWYHRPISEDHYRSALQAFEKALELDPDSAEARTGIVTVLVDLRSMGWATPQEKNNDRAEQLLAEAFDRNRADPRAYYAMGSLRRLQNRFPEARIAIEKAIALEPNLARAHLHLGLILVWMGQPKSALPHIERGFILNPKNQNIQFYYSGLGFCYLFLGRASKAIDFLRKARASTNARLWYVTMWLAAALGLKGEVDEARQMLAEFLELKPEWTSLARLRAVFVWPSANPQYAAIAAKTLELGLIRAGLPEE